MAQSRAVSFDDPGIVKEFQMNGQDADAYRQAYAEKGLVKDRTGLKYALKKTGDGTRYTVADTDQNIFEGHIPTEYPKIAREYIKNRFRHTIIGEGENRAYVDARTGNEYTNPAKVVAPAVFSDKMWAATELDNLVKASIFLQHNEPSRRHPEFPGGFELRRTVFSVADRMFEGILNIGIDNQGRRRLYDLTQLKSLDPGIWVKQHGGAAAQTEDRDSSDTSILSNEGSVKQAKSGVTLPSIQGGLEAQVQAWRNPYRRHRRRDEAVDPSRVQPLRETAPK